MTFKFLLGFFGWLLFIAWEVRRNYRIIEVHKERPDYLNSFFVRGFFAFLCIALMIPNYIDPVMDWQYTIPYLVYEVSSFYLAFDVWLNLRRGKVWDYQGKQSGWLDKLGKPYYYTLKVFCLVLLITSIVVIWR